MNASTVLTAMLPTSSARVLAALGDSTALDLLAASGVQNTVSILRYVSEPRRTPAVTGMTGGVIPKMIQILLKVDQNRDRLAAHSESRCGSTTRSAPARPSRRSRVHTRS